MLWADAGDDVSAYAQRTYATAPENVMQLEFDETALSIAKNLNMNTLDYYSPIEFYKAICCRIEGRKQFVEEMTYMVSLLNSIYI